MRKRRRRRWSREHKCCDSTDRQPKRGESTCPIVNMKSKKSWSVSEAVPHCSISIIRCARLRSYTDETQGRCIILPRRAAHLIWPTINKQMVLCSIASQPHQQPMTRRRQLSMVSRHWVGSHCLTMKSLGINKQYDHFISCIPFCISLFLLLLKIEYTLCIPFLLEPMHVAHYQHPLLSSRWNER